MPPTEVQKWFIHVANRFEDKPLSAAVLEKFSQEIGLPTDVLIALKQSTGSLTARSIIRHLFPSNSRTIEDVSVKLRDAILGKLPSIFVGI